MTSLQLTRPLVVIDTETTGLNNREDRIVDISIIKILPDGKEEMLSSLINPTIPIPVESTEIHGITDSDVQGKPTFKEFAQKIIDFIDNCDLCGFNIKFDLSFLESEYQRAEVTYSHEGRKILDVQHIYYKLEPRDLSSANLRYCGKSLEKAHGAEIDVKATINILESQLKQNDELPRDISGLQEFCNPKDPSWIDDEGKFIWSKGEATINFGKHKGQTFEFMSKNEPDYFRWMAGADFSSEVKKIVEEAIKGEFPRQKN